MTESGRTQTAPSSWNVPNVLTSIRVVLVPVFAWLLLSHPHDQTWRWWATAVFVVAILTDYADGKIARKYNLVTDFGKLWDPIADKALTGMAFIGLSIIGELPWVFTIVILVREWGITLLRSWLARRDYVMAASKGGKAKTLVQSIALILFLPGLVNLPSVVGVIAWILMWLALALTLVTGVDYVLKARSAVKNNTKSR